MGYSGKNRNIAWKNSNYQDMTKKQLEAMVSGVKSPPLDRKQTRKIFEENANVDLQKGSSNEVAQRYAQPVAQEVAQRYMQPVAQEVAQPLWVAQSEPLPVAQYKPNQVAQNRPQTVAQNKSKKVAQNRLQTVAQNKSKKVAQYKPQAVVCIKGSGELSVDKYVKDLKIKMANIEGVEQRKKFAKDIGWGIMAEKRGRQYYLFAGKKLSGKKEKLYIGNAKN